MVNDDYNLKIDRICEINSDIPREKKHELIKKIISKNLASANPLDLEKILSESNLEVLIGLTEKYFTQRCNENDEENAYNSLLQLTYYCDDKNMLEKAEHYAQMYLKQFYATHLKLN